MAPKRNFLGLPLLMSWLYRHGYHLFFFYHDVDMLVQLHPIE